VYPPGYAPYARRRLAPVALDGSGLQLEPTGRGGTADAVPASVRRFDETLFGAAVDAARGRLWPADWQRRRPDARSKLWYSTQVRRIRMVVRLLGLAPELGAELRAAVADVLAVETIVLHEQSLALRGDPGLVATGRAVATVLAALPPTGCLVDRLAEAGHVVGLWGEPWRWEPRRGVVRPRPFQPVGTRAPPRLG
jgi:hypothetical protein